MTKGTDIPKGYKQTKVGVIPEDWGIEKFSSFSEFKNGLNYSKEEKGEGLKIIGVGDFKQHTYISYQDLEQVNLISKVSPDYLLKNNDLLFVRSNGNKDLVGRVLLIADLHEDVSYSGFTIRARINKSAADPIYYAYVFKSAIVKNQFKRLGAGTNISNLSQQILGHLKLPYPQLPEQQKIAEILTTWDKAIENVQLTIDNLKLRNKGLAQQLLTGKKRLNGFDGEWMYLRADKIFKNHTDKSHNGEFEVLSATQERGVIPRSMNNIDIKFDKSSQGTYKKVEVGNYVISLRSFQGGIEYSSYEGLVSPAYTVLKEVLPISKTYYKIYFKTETFINRLNTIIYGIRDGKQISYKDFSTLKLPYPSLEEQNEISRIMEQGIQELQLFEKKLATLKEQKKGLMQQLLTGEIRVRIE